MAKVTGLTAAPNQKKYIEQKIKKIKKRPIAIKA